MEPNTYHYERKKGGYFYKLTFAWEFENPHCIGERSVQLDNLNALHFMIDMLKKLGYKEV